MQGLAGNAEQLQLSVSERATGWINVPAFFLNINYIYSVVSENFVPTPVAI